MAHYFEYDKNLKSKEIERIVEVDGTKLRLITDNGVFSKKGLDFGTRTLLETIDVSKINGDVLDFGCGYGPIGIYIKKNTNSNVTMIDINKRSVDLAIKNAKLNNVDVDVKLSNLYENIDKKFNYIISNPPIRVGKKVLYDILFGAKDYLKENGQLWIVINKDQGAKSVAKDLETEYKVEIVNKNKGFYIICASKH